VADGRACGGLQLFPLDIPEAERDALGSLLSSEERMRAARFRSAQHAERFVVAHARLRQVLAVELGQAPGSIEFAVGPHGKPELAGASKPGLYFNLSHSAGLGLVGWSWQRDIGVDVEVWRPTRDQAALVRRYFSPAEIAAWGSLPRGRRQEAFFNLWTRKEAYVKALGRGLALPLDSFDVNFQNGAGAGLLRQSQDATAGRAWSLAALDVGPAASAAIVLQAAAVSVTPLG
jgi:4'-phosphopantetheinyl transferase